MTVVMCMRGLPGSGKSTIALREAEVGDVVRVNRDDLRQSLFNGQGILKPWQEDMITKVQRETAALALRAGKNVIVDDTNLRSKYLRAWNEFALDNGADFSVFDVTTPVDVCVERDSARERSVGEEVIRELGRRFLRNGEFANYVYIEREPVKPVEFDPTLPNVILVDIDGTLADMGDRSPYAWDLVHRDGEHRAIVDLVDSLWEVGYLPIFLSGRDSVCREATEEWLRKALPNAWRGFDLFMRDEGDTRRDDIVKREIFDREIRGRYNVEFVLDDRDQVVKMWRSLGLTCLQVAEGNF